MKKKLKVMHFVSGIGNDGVQQYLINYTSRLNKNYSIDESIVYQYKADYLKLKKQQFIGNKTFRITAKKDNPFNNLWETYKLLKKEEPDIVEAHMNLSNFFPLFIALLCGVPIRISHSHIAQDIDNINPKLAPVYKMLCIKFATNLVACGKAAGKYMYGNRDFKIIYNAINLKDYSFNLENRKEIRKKYDISDSTVVLGNIGRIVEQKNHKFLIDIFSDYLKKNSDAVLFIIGDGELKPELKKYISHKNCGNKIILISGVESTEKFYSAFDAFVLPSLYEGLPVVGIEAQANGVATLLSKNIDVSMVYSDNVKLLPINKGTDCWVDSIERNSRRNKINNNVKYDIEHQYHKLHEYYQGLS